MCFLRQSYAILLILLAEVILLLEIGRNLENFEADETVQLALCGSPECVNVLQRPVSMRMVYSCYSVWLIWPWEVTIEGVWYWYSMWPLYIFAVHGAPAEGDPRSELRSRAAAAWDQVFLPGACEQVQNISWCWMLRHEICLGPAWNLSFTGRGPQHISAYAHNLLRP
jgi:hypothetical protein